MAMATHGSRYITWMVKEDSQPANLLGTLFGLANLSQERQYAEKEVIFTFLF